MKFHLNRGCIVLLSALLFCFSCGDADLFDTDKWSSKIDGWEPGVKGQILQGSFTLWDLINQGKDSVIIKEGDHLFIQYLEPDIYSIDVKDVFNMPDKDVEFALQVETGITNGVPLEQEVTITTEDGLTVEAGLEAIPAGSVLSKLVASAQFAYPVADFDYYIEVEFPDIKRNGEMLRFTREVGEGEALTETLENIELTLDENQQVTLKVSKIIIREGSTLPNSAVQLNFALKNLKFLKAIGQITANPIDIPKDHFDMDIDFLNEIGGSFTFTKPQLNVIVRNQGIGIPLLVDASFEGHNGNTNMTLALNPGEELYREIAPNQVDTFGFNSSNSNIVPFLSMPPQGNIDYSGTVYVNPKEVSNNEVSHDGKITLDAYIRIPFELSAQSLSYKDTLDDIDIDQKIADKIKEGVIKIVATNELPLNVDIPSLTLISETGETLVLSAVEGHKGLLANGEGIIEYKLNREQAGFLGKTENILLSAIASTPNNGPEVITAKAKLTFSLVLEAKAIIEDYDDF